MKSDIAMTQAIEVLDRVAQEIGLLVSDTSFGKKVQGPSTRHRLYVQRGLRLGRIDTTVPLAQDDPAYVQLSTPIGSIACHVRPDLVQLERVLRMLGDPAIGVQIPNRPRPFAATKAPGPRRPKAVAEPVPAEALESIPIDPARQGLEERIAVIRDRARAARVRMVLENPEKYGVLSEAEAEELVDGRSREDDAPPSNGPDPAVLEALAEAGIEVTK